MTLYFFSALILFLIGHLMFRFCKKFDKGIHCCQAHSLAALVLDNRSTTKSLCILLHVIGVILIFKHFQGTTPLALIAIFMTVVSGFAAFAAVLVSACYVIAAISNPVIVFDIVKNWILDRIDDAKIDFKYNRRDFITSRVLACAVICIGGGLYINILCFGHALMHQRPF